MQSIEARLEAVEKKLKNIEAGKPYLTINEIVQKYKVSRSWVNRLVKKRRIDAVNISETGRANWRIDADSLERYLNSISRKTDKSYVSKFLGV
jgi:excisionase family DNA binding protein